LTPRRAMVSVWDKTGIGELGRALVHSGFEILSTSKTAAVLRDGGVSVTEVSLFTGSPEILGGRVKTLHPKIAGGILTARRDETVEPIDVVVCNLYPFEEGLRRRADRRELVELIDIGGVTLLRAAAKNHEYVAAVPEPCHYPRVIEDLQRTGMVSPQLRAELAARVFELTAHYDAVIAGWLAGSRA